MSERESDIEFDFFEESDTREAAAEERTRRRGPRRPPVRPPTGLTPLLRLVGLISFAILIVLLLVLWVNGCREDRRKDAYKTYTENVTDIADRSQQLGKTLKSLLTSRGKKEADVEQELDGLAQQEQQLVVEARDLEPPGPLRPEHRHVIEALELRFSGLKGMADALRSTASSKSSSGAGRLLADQMKRLVASDVVWDDLFKAKAAEELKNQDITGVAPPESTFVSNPDIATSRSMASVWDRIHGVSTGGGSCTPRGTSLVSVTARPGEQQLSTTELNTISVTSDLAFAVTIEDPGCAQEVRVPVTLTIQQSPSPIVKRETVDLINPGEQKTLIFRNLGTPKFVERTTLTVEVKPVPNEQRTNNNSAQYPVIFSLG